MKKENILLLCDVPPCDNYTSGKMISQLLGFLIGEKYNVYCFCVMDKNLKPEYNTITKEIKINMHIRPSENLTEKQEKKYYKEIFKLQKKLIKYIKSNNITKIWCPLQGEVLTLLLNKAYDTTKIPYIVQIWDSIQWWIKNNNFSQGKKIRTLSEYEKLIKNAKKCITTSIEMSNFLKKQYGVSCIEVLPALKRKSYSKIQKYSDKFVISMVGQIYAKKELEYFLKALDLIKWELNGKKIYFEHYGLWDDDYIDFNKHSKYKNRIIINGFVEKDQLSYKLSKSNILYFPYFFLDDPESKKISEIHFHSKIASYLALDVPILYHGPEYSGFYKFLSKNNCAILMPTISKSKIIKILNNITNKDCESIVKKSKETFDRNFSYEAVKHNFMTALDLEYNDKKRLRILEVNNIDLPGKRFNGYDLLSVINDQTNYIADQIVTDKMSKNEHVHTFYENEKLISKEYTLMWYEQNILSVHSQLSFTSNLLKKNDLFKRADIVHYHLIHNTKLSLPQMIELCAEKTTILTFHDPWNFTGRCVHPQECEKWKTGCKNCEFLDNLFMLPRDNCNMLWKQKKKIYEKMDVDIIVSTPFMKKMLEESPLTNHFKNVHVLPFGINLDKFKTDENKEESRKRFGIDSDEIVLFFRAQMAMKGTEYIIEAMKMLKTNKKVTLLSCSGTGLLEELKDKYKVIDLGHIDDEEMIDAYNACDIFLMPSRGESFGLMAIEAMASSRPIIIFNNTALPYVTFAPDCGVLVENKNSKKLMEAIKMLINNPNERKRRGELGRKLAEENYDINTYNKKMIEIYEKAYERQKNKKIITKDSNYINPNSKDVKALVPKLEKIYKSIFANKNLSNEILKYRDVSVTIDDDYKIDYSSQDVINLIELYNKIMYDELIEYSKFIKIPKIIRTLYLLKNERNIIYDKVKIKLRKIPIFYSITRFIYKIIKRIKNILFCNRCKLLKIENEKLKEEIKVKKSDD